MGGKRKEIDGFGADEILEFPAPGFYPDQILLCLPLLPGTAISIGTAIRKEQRTHDG